MLEDFDAAACRGDGTAFAAMFTENGIYDDYVYGPHEGRDSIREMLEDLFHRDAENYDWRHFDPVFDEKLQQGYAWSLSNFTSTVPEFAGREVTIDGISRFVLKDGLIEYYGESVNGGVAMAQLGVQPERMAKVFAKWAGWLRDRDTTRAYLKRLGRG
jgi:hypothetical protein